MTRWRQGLRAKTEWSPTPRLLASFSSAQTQHLDTKGSCFQHIKILTVSWFKIMTSLKQWIKASWLKTTTNPPLDFLVLYTLWCAPIISAPLLHLRRQTTTLPAVLLWISGAMIHLDVRLICSVSVFSCCSHLLLHSNTSKGLTRHTVHHKTLARSNKGGYKRSTGCCKQYRFQKIVCFFWDVLWGWKYIQHVFKALRIHTMYLALQQPMTVYNKDSTGHL